MERPVSHGSQECELSGRALPGDAPATSPQAPQPGGLSAGTGCPGSPQALEGTPRLEAGVSCPARGEGITPGHVAFVDPLLCRVRGEVSQQPGPARRPPRVLTVAVVCFVAPVSPEQH